MATKYFHNRSTFKMRCVLKHLLWVIYFGCHLNHIPKNQGGVGRGGYRISERGGGVWVTVKY